MMDSDSPRARSDSHMGEGVAIIGMSCLFPGAPDLDTYWSNILGKVDAITDPPPDAWDPEVYYDPSVKANDRVYCKRGGYIGDIAEFRPMDFGVMPNNVDGGEPDQWLALKLAHAALSDAGYPGALVEHERTAVILGKGTYVNRGNMTVGYHGLIVDQVLAVLRNLHPEYDETDIAAIKAELKAGLPPFSADTAPALIGNIIAGRISNRLDLMGPSFTVDAACASALVALEIGVANLLSGRCDLVLAGGANVNTPLPTLVLFCQLGALSRREHIRPFDKDADGTLLAEGLGMLLLKRLSDAERDGDRIYAVIRGVGTASDGRAVHVMAPRVEGEELALRRTYAMAGVSTDSIGLIEAHGTATPVGDAIEFEALSRVFGPRIGSQPTCAIGSVKSMIGHTMPAAGAAGLIKAAYALYHRVLPPTINFAEPDPKFGLEHTPFYFNTETRPWIHGRADTPRRAGVNSFGFGGINGHVVLEEYPGNEGSGSRLLAWESEVCVLEGQTRDGLIDAAKRLLGHLERAGDTTSLKDLAYSLNTGLGDGESYRLAVVAESSQDLVAKLTRALERLADPKCRQIKDNKGIYFFEEPLSREGKLAVMFPGEGAQYPNMLADLCLHFPEVRNCLDLADRAFIGHPRGFVPSDFIFPRSTVSEAERAEMGRRLWEIEGAVEAVLIANRAMWALFCKLGLKPDTMVGHSTGDYSAMFASGLIELPDDASYIETIVAWNSSHERMAKELPVPEAALVAVAADSGTVGAIVEQIGGDLYLAMANCPHQSVIVGERARVDRAVEQLRARGLIYEVLPFDRPYHTPMFKAYAEGEGGEILSLLPLGSPTTRLYSCTTTKPFPSDHDEIHKLFIAHWVEPVLFEKTIEQMYADGVRVFVESGPRGNLTAFVSDILRGRPHLAMPSNVSNRSGINQLNHLVAVLAAQGISLDLGYLYARRDPQTVDWQNAAATVPEQRPPMKLALGVPKLIVEPRARMAPAPKPAAAPERSYAPPPGPAASAPRREASTDPGNHGGAPPSPVPASAAGRDAVMSCHFAGMDAFLSAQQEVMQAFLARVGAAPSAGAPGAWDFPLLGEIQPDTREGELVAVRRLDREHDIFLGQHALGGPVSVTDPSLEAIRVVPLTLSMEILAEAAVALVPGQLVVGMREVQASRWIRVDDEPLTLRTRAERSGDGTVAVEAQVLGADGRAETVIRASVLLADRYPEPPTLPNLTLAEEHRSRLAGVDLYGERLMFHGACLQGVKSIDRSGSDGMTGRLEVLPTEGLFRAATQPRFVTDPVVLDAAGQLVGFWAREYLPEGFVVFPYRVGALDIYGANRPVGEPIDCHLRVSLIGNEQTRSDLHLTGADGRPWMRLLEWEDRRFFPPPRFHHFWTAPTEAALGAPWPAPIAVFTGVELVCWRLDRLFEPASFFWNDLWSSLVLTRNERRAFRHLEGPPTRRRDWLCERSVAKDATRALLRQRLGLELLPGDVEIGEDARGALIPTGAWSQDPAAVPAIAVAQADGTAVAVAGFLPPARHLGVDLAVIRELPPAYAHQALAAEELRLCERMPAPLRTEWIQRIAIAKGAVTNALHHPIPGEGVRVHALAQGTGLVSVGLEGPLAAAHPELAGARLAVHTLREDELLVALTLCERETL